MRPRRVELANNEEQDDSSDGGADNGADLNSSSNSAYIHSEYASYRCVKYNCDPHGKDRVTNW